MNEQEQKIVDLVYKKFLRNDCYNEWTELDTYMLTLETLTLQELMVECKLLLDYHKEGNPICYLERYNQERMGIAVLEGLGLIIDVYNKNNSLTEKEKYIAKYFLVLSHVGILES